MPTLKPYGGLAEHGSTTNSRASSHKSTRSSAGDHESAKMVSEGAAEDAFTNEGAPPAADSSSLRYRLAAIRPGTHQTTEI